MKKLLIIGPSGSGKTTLGAFLGEKYGVDYKSSDDFHGYEAGMFKFLKSPERLIIEGMYALELYNNDKINKNKKNFIMKLPIIIMGHSALVASMRAGFRGKKAGWPFWQEYRTAGKVNYWKVFQNGYKKFRNDRMKKGKVEPFNLKKLNLKHYTPKPKKVKDYIAPGLEKWW